MDTKVCSKCGKEKPLDQYSPNKGGALGVRGRCKACSAEDKAERYDKVAGAAAAREYRAKHPEKAKSAVQKYRTKNKDKVRKRAEDWAKRNPDKVAKYNRRDYEKNREARIAYAVQWQKDNPEKVSARTSKRRSAKLNATPAWANMNAIAAIYSEAIRITIETGVKHHVDHKIPLQHPLVCGLHVESNLQIITAEENVRKSNKFDGGW